MAKKKRQLIKVEQHTWVDQAGITHEITVEVSLGHFQTHSQFMHYEDFVTIKGYHFFIRERWIFEGQEFRNFVRNYDYICCRSGEMAYALRKIKECKSISEIEVLMVDLNVDFRVAMKKDAERELKKSLGLYNMATPPKKRTNKEYKPLKQIKLPWMESK